MKKIIFFILFSVNLFSMDFKFLDYFIIENSYKEFPSGEIIVIGISNLIKYSKDRYLAVLWKERQIPFKDPSIISEVEKQKKEGKIVIDVGDKLPKFEREIYLSFIKKNGKILAESEGIEVSSDKRVSKPFYIEDENSCPYGFINNLNNKIYCFDYSLKLISEIAIPLDKIYDYSISFDGKNHTFWVFGKKENSNKIGKIYEIKNKKWKDIPITIDDIYFELMGKAKGPDNERAKFSKKSFKIYAFKDKIYDLGSKVVLSIDESDSEKENYFNTRRHFFEVSIGTDKNIQLNQINLWFEFSDIEEIKWDEEKSILFFPSLYKEKNAGFASLGEKSFIFFLVSAFSFPDNEGKYNEKVLDFYPFFFIFQSPSAKPDYVDDFIYKIKEKIYEETKEKDKLLLLPIFWNLDKSEFLFLCPCRHDRESCYALVEMN